VRAETSLTASVGLATRSSWRKIASDMRKPDGLVVVPPGTEAAFLAPLPVRRLWGVGPKTEESLARLGISHHRRPGGLAPRSWSVGSGHARPRPASAGARARRPPVVSSGRGAKSMGHEHTFACDTATRDVLRATLLALCDAVARRAAPPRLRGRTVTLKYRDETFRTLTRARHHAEATDAGDAAVRGAWALFRTCTAGGACACWASPRRVSGDAATSWACSRPRRARPTGCAITIADRFGDGALVRASVLEGAGDDRRPVGGDRALLR
jgi:DNA polymerase-4